MTDIKRETSVHSTLAATRARAKDSFQRGPLGMAMLADVTSRHGWPFRMRFLPWSSLVPVRIGERWCSLMGEFGNIFRVLL